MPSSRHRTPPDQLAHWEPHFPVETRRRGAEYARSGRVEVGEYDGARVAASVRGTEPYQVRIDLRSSKVSGATCDCPVFATSGPCKHIWAVLQFVLGGVRNEGGGGQEATRLRTWLASLRRLEQESEDGTPAASDEEPSFRVDYVLVLDAPGAQTKTVLETRRARPLSRGGFGKSSPFALLAPRKDVVLAPADRRVAALLRGAGSLYADQPHSRADSRYFLDAEQTEALLPDLCATGRLFWARGGHTSTQPLALDAGPSWKACTTLSTQGDEHSLRLGVRLERGAEQRAAGEVRGLLAGERIVLEERIVHVRLGKGRAWFQAMLQAPPPPFSAADAPGLLLELAQRELDAEPGPGLEALIAARRPTPHLLLSAPRLAEEAEAEADLRGDVLGKIEFDYGVARVAASDRRPLLPTGRGVLRRYFEVEDVLLARPAALGARARSRGELDVALEDVAELVRALTEEGWIVQGEGAKWRSLGAPRVTVKSGVDWFELEGRFAGVEESVFPKLLAALRHGQTTVRLDDGTTGVVPAAWLARWRTALLLGESKDGKLRFRSQQAWFVDLLLEEFVDKESRRLWEEQRARLGAFEHPVPQPEPPGFVGTLRPYQKEGLGWLEFLARQRLGGCLADDMGLGKTVQVLAWLQARKQRDPKAAPALIVAPKSLTHNWSEEARHFTPELRTLEYVGSDRKRLRESLGEHDLVLTTYGTVRGDIEILNEVEFGVVVLDEAQAIKNESSQTARRVRLLRAEHRLALSGTPIENHVGELWSLFEFLNPGMLGRSSAFQSLVAATPDGQIDTQARALIARAVRPFLLRRTKEEVLRDLPERSEQILLCEMEPEQRKEYTELREHFRRELLVKKSDADLQRAKLGILEMLLRLRQAACHPGLLDSARGDEGCAKFEALFPMLEEVLESGHKALVFSQFTSFLALVRRRLDASGRAYGYLDGKTSAKKRAEEVERFQEDPEQKLFLVSLKAGGTGLNLTAADYVFLLDPWWNPAVEAQAIGRSHRIGQERNVFAYRLVCRDTIEERVLELQASKRELASAILGGDGALVRDLTREDLERLLS